VIASRSSTACSPWQDELRRVLSAAEALHRTAAAVSEPDIAGLRDLGHDWARAHRPLAPLLLAVEDLTGEAVAAAITGDHADVPRLVENLRGTGIAVVRGLLTGIRTVTPRLGHRRLTAASLLWGVDVPVGPGHAVIALRSRQPGITDLGRHVDDALNACGRADVLHLLRHDSGYLLGPAHDEQDAADLAVRLCEHLPGAVWLATAWRTNTEIGEGRQETSVVLDLVTSLDEPPGTYGVEDVVVEYALMEDTSALVALLALIAPVVHRQSLRTALEALVATGGNRTKAAKILEIHRSTLDYRLGRVEQLTGQTPLTARGLQTLAAALTMHDVTHNLRRTRHTRP
jgi:hypothetical protein